MLKRVEESLVELNRAFPVSSVLVVLPANPDEDILLIHDGTPSRGRMLGLDEFEGDWLGLVPSVITLGDDQVGGWLTALNCDLRQGCFDVMVVHVPDENGDQVMVTRGGRLVVESSTVEDLLTRFLQETGRQQPVVAG